MKIATCMKRYKPTIRCDRLFSSLCADSPRIDMRRQRRFVARLFSSLREHRQFNGPERKENGLKLLWKKDLFPFCGHFFFLVFENFFALLPPFFFFVSLPMQPMFISLPEIDLSHFGAFHPCLVLTSFIF